MGRPSSKVIGANDALHLRREVRFAVSTSREFSKNEILDRTSSDRYLVLNSNPDECYPADETWWSKHPISSISLDETST